MESFLTFAIIFLSEDEALGKQINDGLLVAPQWLLHRIADQIVQWSDYVSGQRCESGISQLLNSELQDRENLSSAIYTNQDSAVSHVSLSSNKKEEKAEISTALHPGRNFKLKGDSHINAACA